MFIARESGEFVRHAYLIWPLWNLLDQTPEGRGDFRPKLGCDWGRLPKSCGG